MQDYVKQRTEGGANWTWSSLIPNAIVGFATRSWMSILQVIAVYGTVCKELGLPMRWPTAILPESVNIPRSALRATRP